MGIVVVILLITWDVNGLFGLELGVGQPFAQFGNALFIENMK